MSAQAADDRRVTPVESVRRALRILASFEPDRPEFGVSELARDLGLHKSTVHRLLVTMQHEGFIGRSSDGRYTLGRRAVELGRAFPAWTVIHGIVTRHLTVLADRTGETAQLAVLDGAEVLYLEKVDSARFLQMPSAVGRRLPAYSTALGKVLLAGLRPVERDRVLAGADLRPLTTRTLVDRSALADELERTAARGYGIDREEIEEGLMCIAAPVTDPDDTVCAAVSIAGPASRMRTHQRALVAAVRDVTDALSDDLGWRARRLLDARTRGPEDRAA